MKTLSWYEKQLESSKLSPSIRTEYEQEADRLAAQLSRVQEKQRQEQEKQRQEREQAAAELKAKSEEIAKLFHSAPDTLFASYGSEFIDDYEINGLTVLSKVSREDQNGEWTHPLLRMHRRR